VLVLTGGTGPAAVAETAEPTPSPTAEPTTQVEGDDQADAPTDGTRGIANVAHKGFSAKAPENTMPAVRQAIAEQGDFQGIDVRMTLDGRLVVLHDASLARTTDVEEVFPSRSPWDVGDFTYREIKRLDAGSWLRTWYAGTKVPTLARMLRELDESPSGVFLEVKNPTSYPGIGDRVVEVIRDRTDWLDPEGTDHRLVVQSFNERWLHRFHTAHPDVPVGALGAYRLEDLSWLDQVNVRYTQLDPDEVLRVHSAGAQISVYTVDDRSVMEAMADQGVDAIATNRPRLLHEVLLARGANRPHGDFEIRRASHVGSVWDLSAPSFALRDTRVKVRATFDDESGNAVRWSWVKLQVYRSGGWHTLQRRATDADGRVRTTFHLRRDATLRFRPFREMPSGTEPSPPVSIDARRADTVVRLRGPHEARRRQRVRLPVRWYAVDGRPVTGRVTLWAHPRGAQRWSRIRRGQVDDGRRSFWVRPRRTTRYEVRGTRGWWWHGDRDRHRVVVER
jgi:glycerophosphoryl diester phosphodiesterase